MRTSISATTIGILSLANSGQFISIGNNIGETGASAQVQIAGASTLQLSGSNTYTGGTSVVGGTVQVTNINSVGTGAVLLDGGTFQSNGIANLDFTNNFSVTTSGGILDANGTVLKLSGTVSDFGGGGFVAVTNSSGSFGTVVLSGTNTYTSGTSVTNATVRVTNTSSVGSGVVLLNGGTFQVDGLSSLTFTNNFLVAAVGGGVDNNGTVLTLSGVIADVGGPGVLNITDSSGGAGTTVLSGVNTYSGGTNVIGARVQVTNASSIGGGALTLDNGVFQAGAAGLTFFNDVKVNTGGGTFDSNGNTLSIAGNITDGNGPGALTIIDSTGGGMTELAGTNTYSGGTTVTNTTLQVTNNASVGTGTVTLDEARFQTDGLGGNLTFTNNFQINNSASGSIIDASGVVLTIAGNISDGAGAGKLTIDDRFGGGKVVLLGNNTYTGGTEICFCGTLQLGDATHTASLVGDITNFGQLAVVNANLSGVTSLTNDGGFANFLNATSAGSMTINNINGAQLAFGSFGGTDQATAGSATIINDGSTVGFLANTSAGSATINNINGAQLFFGTFGDVDKATAGSATILNDASLLAFFANTKAGTAQITNQNGRNTLLRQGLRRTPRP